MFETSLLLRRLLLPEGLWSHKHLLKEMVLREFRTEILGTALGPFWLIARPLFLSVVYVFVFGFVLEIKRRSGGVVPFGYALFLLSGLIPWLAFSEAAIQGSNSLVQNRNIIQKTALPPTLMPTKVALVAFLRYLWLLPLIALLAQNSESAFLIKLPLLVVWALILMLFTLHFTVAIAILSAAFRDMALFMRNLFGMLIFMSGVLYPLEMVPEGLRFVLYFSPFTPFAEGFHSIVVDGQFPEAGDLVFSLLWLILSAFTSWLFIERSRESLPDWL